MGKFTIVNLAAYYNADRDPAGWPAGIGERLQELPDGSRTFWGIPFALGPRDGECWLSVQQRDAATEIPLAGTASYVIVAHFCGGAPGHQGAPGRQFYEVPVLAEPGLHLADYVLVYEDGCRHRQAIRRRFEVAEMLVPWGQRSFAARPHADSEPCDWRGPYPTGCWGEYQTGVRVTFSSRTAVYWLYALENPYPAKSLTAIRVESTGASRLVLAGLTLYHGQDHPLRHRRLESLCLTLPEAVLPKDVGAAVDLGVICRQYAVPAFDADEWIHTQPRGWGEEPAAPTPTRQHFLDITANADATLQVAGHEVELRGVYQHGHGDSRDGQVHVELLSPRKTWVHVTIVDETTGRPTPARVHFRTAEGRYVPPYGHRQEVNDDWFEDYGADLKLGSTQYAYVDGTFQIELPVGEVYVEVVKGFEYQPVRQRLLIQPDQRHLELRISRPFDWRRRGWVTADTHVHFLSPQTAWLEAQAEGVNLVNLLASQWGDLFTNVGDITGLCSGVSGNDTVVWVGTENRQHLLGHISLLGGKNPPVFPMCAGGPAESSWGDPTWMSLAEWADRCREREGLVVIPHFPDPYCEVAADIVLGKVDAVEIRHFTPQMDSFGIREWYRFLNCGYRLGAVGGTDKMSAGMPVGGVRTYTQLREGEPLTFARWAEAVRSGRTFTSSGPLLWMMVEGRAPGSEIHMPGRGGTLEAEVWVQSVQPVDELQLVVNGQIVARQPTDPGSAETRFRTRLQVTGSSWIAARCLSRLKVWHCWPISIAAHTSPVYVRCGDEELFRSSDAMYMLTLIEGGLTWLETLSIPASPERQAQIRGIFEAARSELSLRAEKHRHTTGQSAP